MIQLGYQGGLHILSLWSRILIVYLISRSPARQASEWLPMELERRIRDAHRDLGTYFKSQVSLKVTRPRSVLAKPVIFQGS